MKGNTWLTIKVISGYIGDTNWCVLAACMPSPFGFFTTSTDIVVKCGVCFYQDKTCVVPGLDITIEMDYSLEFHRGMVPSVQDWCAKEVKNGPNSEPLLGR